MFHIREEIMKILHILATGEYSGAENVVCQIIKNNANSHTYMSPQGIISDILKEKGIRYKPIESLTYKNVRKAVQEIKPDIIHAHDFRASIIASKISKRHKCNVISHLHNNPSFIYSKNLKSTIFGMYINRFRQIVCVSDEIKNKAIFLKKYSGDVTVLPNYIPKNEILKLSGNPEIEYDICYVGRLVEQKGIDTLLSIFKLIINEYPELRIVIIGDGELRETIENFIEENKYQKNIDLLGFQTNPYKYIASCKLVVMPSKWEGFGLTAIESMVLNKPVFNSGVGGLGNIFSTNKELICSSPIEYKKKITNFLESDEYSKKIIDTLPFIIEPYTNENKYRKSIEYVYRKAR